MQLLKEGRVAWAGPAGSNAPIKRLPLTPDDL